MADKITISDTDNNVDSHPTPTRPPVKTNWLTQIQKNLIKKKSPSVQSNPKKKHKITGIRCKFCPSGSPSSYFPSRKALLSHKLEQHSEELSYVKQECDICHTILSSKRGLRNHKAVVHSEVTYSCKKCGKDFKTIFSLRRHKLIHDEVALFMCNLCSKGFSREDQLKSHIVSHSTKREFSCTLCTETFKRSAALRAHFQSHTGEKPFSCDSCSEEFNSKEKLATHMKLVHIGVENVKRSFLCKICKKGFQSSYHLKLHMKVHDEVKRFACKECDFRTRTSTNLKLHVGSMHSDGKIRGTCPICGKGFKSKYYMRQHVKRHGAKKTIPCYFCSKKFNAKQPRDIHMIVHIRERPYTCSKNGCGKAFFHNSSQRIHERMHNGVKEFACANCGGAWFQKGNFDRHDCKSVKLKTIPCKFNGCDLLFKTHKTAATHFKRLH